MKLLVKKVPGLVIPTKANPTDAAYDLVATTPPKIVGQNIKRPLDGMLIWSRVVYIEYGTNLYVAPEQIKTQNDWGFFGTIYNHTMLFPRSSISKYNLVLANSVATIDDAYRGQIMLRFKYVFAPEDLVTIQEAGGTRIYGAINNDAIYQEGDKICQMKACQNIDIQFEEVDDLDTTTRGEGGFGSSGK